MKPYLFLSALLLVLASCKPVPKNPPVVSIEDERLKDDWTAADLFQTQLPRHTDVIDLTPADTAQIEIRAFQHRFFDNTDRLKPTWVVGYVKAGTRPGSETLPGPVLRTTYGQPTHVRYVNRLKETMLSNPLYPLLKRKLNPDTTATVQCRWFPIIYNLTDPDHVDMVAQMLYPLPFDSIPICRLPSDSLRESSSYYSTTVHLHGANVSWRNDGYVNSSHFVTQTPFGRAPITFGLFGPAPDEKQPFVKYTYPNTFPEGRFNKRGQPDDSLGRHGALLWYHDHSMMRTTTNVYAGMAGAYIVQGKDEYGAMDEVYPNLNNRRGAFRRSWEWITRREDNDIPLLISDKSFTTNGLLYYNTTASPTNSDTLGVEVQPEFLGNTITVNGKIWPSMTVEAEPYRFRLLNASSTRFYQFGLRLKHGTSVVPLPVAKDSSVFVQIGTEGGLMPKFVYITANTPLTLAPGERADVLIDFSRFDKRDSLMLVNLSPNAVYQGDSTVVLTTIDSTNLTNFVMAFVVDATGDNTPGQLTNRLRRLQGDSAYLDITANLTTLIPLTDSTTHRLTLVEATSFSTFPPAYQLFAKNETSISYPMVLMSEQDWNSETTHHGSAIKRVQSGDTEVWAIRNETGDRHPIHIHLNRFKIIGRRVTATGALVAVSPNEQGWKDVVQCPPEQTTYILVNYLLSNDATQQTPGPEAHQFVYHCHILEHEDASMMRRLVVTRSPTPPVSVTQKRRVGVALKRG